MDIHKQAHTHHTCKHFDGQYIYIYIYIYLFIIYIYIYNKQLFYINIKIDSENTFTSPAIRRYPFFENYTMLYFDARHLEKRLKMGW